MTNAATIGITGHVLSIYRRRRRAEHSPVVGTHVSLVEGFEQALSRSRHPQSHDSSDHGCATDEVRKVETLFRCHRPDHDIQVRHVDDHDRATHEDERGTQQPLQQGAFHECPVSTNCRRHASYDCTSPGGSQRRSARCVRYVAKTAQPVRGCGTIRQGESLRRCAPDGERPARRTLRLAPSYRLGPLTNRCASTGWS